MRAGNDEVDIDLGNDQAQSMVLPKYLKLDFYMHSIYDSQVLHHHQLTTKYFQRFRTNLIEIIAKFLKYMAMKVSMRPCEFNVRKGCIRQSKVSASKMYISIRDPFVPYLNHGASLYSRE